MSYDIFSEGGLSEPLSLLMPLYDPLRTLEYYIGLALQLSGFTFLKEEYAAVETKKKKKMGPTCKSLASRQRTLC